MSFSKLIGRGLSTCSKFVQSHGSEILFAGGVASGIATVALGIRAGHQAERHITGHVEIYSEVKESFDTYARCDTVKTYLKYRATMLKHTWPYYIPPIVSGGVSILCFSGAYFIRTEEKMKLMSAAVAAETLVNKYQDQFLEPKSSQPKKLNEAIDEPFYEKAAEEFDTAKGHGDVVYFDAITGLTFRSSEKEIRRAEADILRDLASASCVSVSEFYEALDPDIEPGVMCDYFGWGNGLQPHITFSARMVDGKPVGVVHYKSYYLEDLRYETSERQAII